MFRETWTILLIYFVGLLMIFEVSWTMRQEQNVKGLKKDLSIGASYLF